jgi:oxygen-independent coproporphyrinogen-3 oxidase
MPDTDEVAYEREFLLAHDVLEAAGFDHYEVSNFARPGRHALHNAAYWRRVPYVGLGPSAHSFDGTCRRWNEREYRAWSERCRQGVDPVAGVERLDAGQAALEQVYLGLRTSVGVQLSPSDRPLVESWARNGWVRTHGDRARLTAKGWLRLDGLASALTEPRSRF